MALSVRTSALAAVLGALVAVTAASPVGATRTHGAPSGDAAALRTYLAAASWPVRAATARVARVEWATGFLVVQPDPDPPLLRMLPGMCANVQALRADPRGSVEALTAPARLRPQQLLLANAYATVRAGCKEMTPRVRAWYGSRAKPSSPAEVDARRQLRQFVPALQSFSRAVRAWRFAVIHYASALGVPPPVWVGRLGR